jgi:class III cytochrome C family protein
VVEGVMETEGALLAAGTARSRWFGQLVAVLLAAPVWMASTTVMAQTSMTDEVTCIGCHRPQDTAIDPARFGASVHGHLDCTTCHPEGFARFPHTGTRASAQACGDCHDVAQKAKDIKASIHARRVDPAFGCTHCHSPHYQGRVSDIADAVEAARIANASCLRCHAKGETERQQAAARTRLGERHRFVPHWELHLRSTPCIACHTPSGQETVHLILPASQALRRCETCHARNSMMATKLYAHLAQKERAERGWVNAVLFNNAYVAGATRNRWLDWTLLGLVGVLGVGLGLHGGGRWLCAWLRRKTS